MTANPTPEEIELEHLKIIRHEIYEAMAAMVIALLNASEKNRQTLFNDMRLNENAKLVSILQHDVAAMEKLDNQEARR